MSIEKPILETYEQQIALEDCTDPDVTAEQITALQENDIHVTKGRARIAGARIGYTLLQSPNPVDPVKTIISGGWMASDRAYKPLAINMVLSGHDVVLLKSPRIQNPKVALSKPHREDVLLLQAQADWAAMRMIGDDVYDQYGHSTGFDIILRVANEKAHRVRNVVAAGGSGTIGDTSFWSMLCKTGGVIRHDIGRNIQKIAHHGGAELALGTAWHFAQSPVRVIREGVTVAHSNNVDRMLRARDQGVKIGGLILAKDGYFDPDSVLENCGRAFDLTRVIPDASHVHPQEEPEEHCIETAAMLEALNLPMQRAIA